MNLAKNEVALYRSFASWTPAKKLEYIRSLPEAQALQLKYAWPAWARSNQLAPPGNWSTWVVKAGRGWGKALAIDTEIPTVTGWSTMGDLRVGDMLFDETGKPTKVTFVTPIMHGHTCYNVVFSDGSVITADAEHQWLTSTHAVRKSATRGGTIQPSVVTTEEIKATLLQGKRGDCNHSIPVCGPLQCEPQFLLIDPYVLGAWLGDGTSKAAEITGIDLEILQEIERAGYLVKARAVQKGKTPRYSIGVRPCQRDASTGRTIANGSLHSQLRSLGVLKNKQVPKHYLRASAEQRLALLQGLMDTDGSAQVGGFCEFLCCNASVSYAVYDLCISLGIKATMAIERATLYGKDCGPRYRVSFTPYIPVFRLPRKLARLHQGKSQRVRQLTRYIVAVREVPSVPVCCIQVDSDSHLFLAGRSCIPTHNTRTGAEWVISKAKEYPGCHIALIGRTVSDVRDVMVKGMSGILPVSPPWFMPIYLPSKRSITWPNGSHATTYSADVPDQLRGPQHAFAWLDELASWYTNEAFDQMSFGLRIEPFPGVSPQCIVTTTPRNTKAIKALLKDPSTVVTNGSTYDNKDNLSTRFLREIVRRYQGTRLGAQEIEGEVIDDIDGALWKRAWIDNCRVSETPDLKRIVVAIDPPATSAETNLSGTPAEAGIIVMGLGVDNHGYVLDDVSLVGTPDEWSSVAIAAYEKYQADLIVGEVNNGGDMVGAIIKAVAQRNNVRNIPFEAVRASRGKQIRAEPVSTLYQRQYVHHVGTYPDLEWQMCNWIPGEKSPDRLDSLVWCATKILLGNIASGGMLIPLIQDDDIGQGWF